MGTEFLQLTLVPLSIGILCAVTCAMLGNFLILRRQALVTDAISHVVLLGIVGAFLVTGTINELAMFVGASVSAIVAVGLVEVLRRGLAIESSAAIGVVFTTLFAAGVVLLEQGDAGSVHLDVEHALFGNLESLIWISAENWASLVDSEALSQLPDALKRVFWVAVVSTIFVIVAWRPLAISTFDERFAYMVGIFVRGISLLLAVLAAFAAVAAFDAVGSILVVAMFICPPAAARLLTNRLGIQVWWSIGVAVVSSVSGFVIAGYGPGWIGMENSLSAAGMIAVVAGAILAVCSLFGPCRKSTNLAIQG